MTDLIDRFQALALTFPSLATAVSQRAIEPDFTPEDLEAWSGRAGSPGQLAAHFCLHVWDRRPVDLSRCLQVWDVQHRAAFAAWAAEPFYLCSADVEMATHWRRLAEQFPLVERFVRQDRLPERPEPRHLLALLEEALSPTESTIVRFLLHVWNRYENPFALDDLLGWDDKHRKAFTDWFSGRATGQPGQYF